MDVTLALVTVSLWTVVVGLSHDGCDDGWVALHHHCYYFGVQDGDITPAVSACSAMDAHLASLWGGEERDFIVDKLWKPHLSRDNFVWYGLYGNALNKWAWRDGSIFESTHLDTPVAGSATDKSTKCGALKGTGNYAFLDCSMEAQAYVCKKALPMVYTTSQITNYSSSPLDHFQLFERVVPPELSALPSPALEIGARKVASETGCAYYCFSVKACTAFEYKCLTGSACGNFTCKLLYNV